jgi:hypothetical protein
MEAVNVQHQTFITSGKNTVERSTAKLMEAIEVQLNAFLNTAPHNVER